MSAFIPAFEVFAPVFRFTSANKKKNQYMLLFEIPYFDMGQHVLRYTYAIEIFICACNWQGDCRT